ncbi:MAG: hypothetical protein Q4E60_10850, partial [Bacteroidales bacterium]|nr:hypothetical protein [Bacteroidales bacterium]
ERMIHNHEVPGSIPGPATKRNSRKAIFFDYNQEASTLGCFFVPIFSLLHQGFYVFKHGSYCTKLQYKDISTPSQGIICFQMFQNKLVYVPPLEI